MTDENKKLKEGILNILKDNGIEPATNILGALDQVFDEFEFISSGGDDAFLYMKSDILEFQEDMTFTNAYNIVVDGISSGVYNATYTYTGDIDYVVNEQTDLMYKNEVIETLVEFKYQNKTKVKNPDEWVITVVETIHFGDGDYSRIPKLYIYCPYEEKDING